MNSRLLAWKAQLKVAWQPIWSIIRRPAYLLIGVAAGFLALGLLVWITNLGLLWSVLTDSNLGLSERWQFFLDGYGSIITNYEPLAAIILPVLAILFGVNVAVLIFVLRRSAKKSASLGGSGVAGIGAGAIGAGCAACGTSILAPVLSSVGAAGSFTLAGWIGLIANIVAVVLLVFSIYQLGLKAVGLDSASAGKK